MTNGLKSVEGKEPSLSIYKALSYRLQSFDQTSLLTLLCDRSTGPSVTQYSQNISGLNFCVRPQITA